MASKFIKKLIPAALKKKVKEKKRASDFKKFKESAVTLSKGDLVKGFQNAGIEKGDVLFIHSSLKGLGYIENGAKDVIEAFQEVVGTAGTLIFPTFTMKGSMEATLKDPEYVFDPKTSVSTTGSITNHFMKFKDVHRSIHPTHSVSAWGKHAADICAEHYELDTNFGPGTPFGKFLDLNGKVVGLGIDYGNVTYYHVYEDYNLDKWPEVYISEPFKAKVKDYQGNIHECETYAHNPSFHSSRIEKVPEIERFFCSYLEGNQISFRSEIGQGHLWWMKSQDLLEHLDELYKQGKSIYKVT